MTDATNPVTPDRKAKARAAVQRHRASRPARYDYMPSAAAAAVIERWRDPHAQSLVWPRPDTYLCGVLDRLVLAADLWLRERARLSGKRL